MLAALPSPAGLKLIKPKSVRQRRRDNNSCGQQSDVNDGQNQFANGVEGSVSSHRGGLLSVSKYVIKRLVLAFRSIWTQNIGARNVTNQRGFTM